MSSEFPKLSAKLDEILEEFDRILIEKIAKGEIEDVELDISEENFVNRQYEYIQVHACIDGDDKPPVLCTPVSRSIEELPVSVKHNGKYYVCKKQRDNSIYYDCRSS